MTRLAMVAVVALAACSHNAEVRDLSVRVAKLETRAIETAKLEQRVANLEATTHKMTQLVASLEQSVSTLASTLERFDASLVEVTAKLDRVASKIDRPARPRRRRPEPNEVYSVPVDGSPYRGPRDAKVTMIRAFEFACPFCERSRGTMDQLIQDYGPDLRIVYKHFIVHPQAATIPAQAACAAAKQKRFFDMERAIWERGYKAGRDLSASNMETLARDLGLNMRRFKRDMNGSDCARRVRQDQELMRKVGARGTPAFFINGRFLSGARPVQSFKQLIDEELAKADRVMKSQGIKKRDYYRHIVDTGKKSL